MKFLVTGSKGYIGSHMTWGLRSQEHEVYELKSDIRNYDQLSTEIGCMEFDCVFHFAGLISVSESTENIKDYYETNVMGTINLLEAITQNDCSEKIVFSSSAAANEPNNPYGSTKKIGEMILADYARSYGMKYVALRYFNAAGANVLAGLYENHVPETHIIPLMLKAAKYNKTFTIFGNDYDTKDGTCVRDYIHVMDLVDAHISAFKYLDNNAKGIFDLGTGVGTSNLELLKMVEFVTGVEVKHVYGKRRQGDPAILVASPAQANWEMSWYAKRSLFDIVQSAQLSLKDRM